MYGIVNHGSNRYELQANHRRVAVVDDWNEAQAFAALPELMAALELIQRFADIDNLDISEDEWDQFVSIYLAARRNDETDAVFDAIYHIAQDALAKMGEAR